MNGVYKSNNADDRILLRPPSTIGTQTNFDNEIQGFDNPLHVELETSLDNGAVKHTETNGNAHHPEANGTAVANGTSTTNGAAASPNEELPPKNDVSTPSDGVNDDEDDNPDCGWYKWRPNCVQCCNNIVGYTFFLSVFVIAQGMTVNGLVYVVITTLERRFGFPSVKSGLISSSYDFTVMVIIIFVTYFGEKAHKPIWLGIGALIFGVGSLIFTLPHYITGDYQYQNADFEMCDPNRPDFGPCEDMSTLNEGLTSYYGVFIFAQVLHGIGASPLYTLGITYIDENVSSAASGIYIGIFKSMAILGPAAGYIIGGILLGLYVDIRKDPNELDIDPSSPTWVGAWWLGFIVAAGISFSIVIPFLAFPRSLPGGKKVFAQRKHETQRGMEFETKTGWGSIAQFPRALWMLIKNLPFMFNNISTACETFILVAVGVFGPKYMESQFNLTSGQAAILAGIIVTPSSFIGALFGGWVVKRFDLKYKGMLRFTLGVLICSLGLQFVFFMSCESIDFAGVTVDYKISPGSGDQDFPVDNVCNEDCKCTHDFQPVCGHDDVLYYSPCHAGCSFKNSSDDDSSVTYYDCACIPSAANETVGYGHGTGGRCEYSCQSQTMFVVIAFLLITVTSMIAVPQLTATLRCVAPSQRTFALGVQSVIYRCLGSIPGPIIFGSLIDRTCLIWEEEECDDSRTCWLYNNADFSRYTLIMLQSAKGLSILCIILALVTYKPPSDDEEKNDDSAPTTVSAELAEIPRVEDHVDEKAPQFERDTSIVLSLYAAPVTPAWLLSTSPSASAEKTLFDLGAQTFYTT
ncbi:solute carrier organic anion transporter family member 4A1-like [Diadema antillarum]|uniref:solute carrier organic anion transporter family member 4A1-like n=1 Tax=Diadema antillarum TaxID=105358 RepID=UPI003A8A18A2